MLWQKRCGLVLCDLRVCPLMTLAGPEYNTKNPYERSRKRLQPEIEHYKITMDLGGPSSRIFLIMTDEHEFERTRILYLVLAER